MVLTKTERHTPRSLLKTINNIPVINSCQQALATKTPGRAQLAITSHPGLLYDASCTQPGLTTRIYIKLSSALRAIGQDKDDLLNNNARR